MTRSTAGRSPRLVYPIFLIALSVALGLPTQAPLAAQTAAKGLSGPLFSKTFTPDTIGPGSVSTLVFTIDNTASGTGVGDLAFSDTLPAGVTIASPAAASTTCGVAATLSAPAGGTTISLSGGVVGAGASCTVRVNVTSATPGTHMNVSGDLTSSAGNSGTASDDLTVDTGRPGFTKSFSPSTVALGERSTLTFTIDNTANAAPVTSLDFTDTLPTGMIIASPSNAATDCGNPTLPASLIAAPGTGTISLSHLGTLAFPSVGAGSSCTVTVDVVATGAGALGNVSGELSATVGASFVSSGKAGAVLTVTVTDLALVKDFTDDPVVPGSTVTLEFTIFNFDRDFPATAVAFTDDLDAVLPGTPDLSVSGPLPSDPCGAGSTLTVAAPNVLTLAGGTLPADGSCTFSVTLAVPAGSPTGKFTNTTGAVTGTVDGDGEVGNAASAELFVAFFPLLTKEFTDDPVGAGDTVTLEFTITNTSADSGLDAIEFTDELTAFLPFPVSVGLPPVPDPPCGTGSSMSLVSCGFDCQALSLTGGTLAAAGMPDDSCTFTVTIDIPVGFPQGTYPNTTSQITAILEFFEDSVTGPGASDDLVVVAAPHLAKEFIGDPVEPGDLVTLEFTLEHDALAPGDATGVTFTDDLAAALAGLAAAAGELPLTDVCGLGNGTLTGSAGDTFLTFSGATLTPGQVCTFSLTVDVPGTAPIGSFTNTTSDVTATVLGVTATENPATDDLEVIALLFTKEFTDDPVIAGGTATLSFSIANLSATDDATGIVFFDVLSSVLPGLVAVAPLPAMPCGPSSSILDLGGGFLFFSGGEVPAGAFCTFSVTVMVPAATPDDSYVNTTSSLTAIVGGSGVVQGPAADFLVVDSTRLALAKAFTDDPVAPGGTVNLRFTLTNLDAAEAASGIAFSDDLDAALSGLLATGLPVAGCGGTATTSDGGMTVDFSGGSLAGGASCFFDISVSVPAAAPSGTFTNTTSGVTGTITGLPVTGDAATDRLRIVSVTFAKAFDGPTVAGGTPQLTFTLTNLSTTSGVSDLAFTDNLGATLSGLAATGLPAPACGGTISGTSLLAFSGGSLGPSDSCTITVDLLVPAGAPAGGYLNTTSDLFSAGLSIDDPATDTLLVEPPPIFSKSFAPDTIGVGETSVLTFSIDNSASGVAATALAFTDGLPGVIEVAATPNASTTCGAGTVTAAAGSGSVSLAGGSVAANGTCEVTVTVVGVADGTALNTSGELTSSSGSSGTTSAEITVVSAIGFAKAFLTAPVLPGGLVDLEFTITNTSLASLTGLAFTDDLDAVIPGLVAVGLPTDPCGAGSTLTGTSVLALTGGSLGPGASCTFVATLQVPANAPAGSYLNVTSLLTAIADGALPAPAAFKATGPVAGPAASATLVVAFLDLGKAFPAGPVPSGGLTTLTFTLVNPDPVNAATGITFTDDLDAVLPGLVAVGLPQADVCGAGSQLTGTSLLTLTGGSLGPGASCMFTVTLDLPAALTGTYTNVTSAVDAIVGGLPVAGDPADAAVATLDVEASTIEIPTLGEWGLALLALGLLALGWHRLRRRQA